MWPTTKPNMMTPVTAITTFLPLVDCQNVTGSVGCKMASVVLMNLSQPCRGETSRLRGSCERLGAASRKVQLLPCLSTPQPSLVLQIDSLSPLFGAFVADEPDGLIIATGNIAVK